MSVSTTGHKRRFIPPTNVIDATSPDMAKAKAIIWQMSLYL